MLVRPGVTFSPLVDFCPGGKVTEEDEQNFRFSIFDLGLDGSAAGRKRAGSGTEAGGESGGALFVLRSEFRVLRWGVTE